MPYGTTRPQWVNNKEIDNPIYQYIMSDTHLNGGMELTSLPGYFQVNTAKMTHPVFLPS